MASAHPVPHSLGCCGIRAMIAIPMSTNESHLRENFAAADFELTAEDLAQVDAQCPPPKRKRALATT